MFSNLGLCDVFQLLYAIALPYGRREPSSRVTCHCKDEFTPHNITAQYYCRKTDVEYKWVPVLEPLYCTALKLSLHNQSTTFFCPWDSISYKCIVNSTDPNAYIKWHIKFPNVSSTQTVVYDRNSIPKRVKQLIFHTSTILNVLIRDEYMESIITFTPTLGIDLRRTQLDCTTLDHRKSILLATDGIPSGMFCTIIIITV